MQLKEPDGKQSLLPIAYSRNVPTQQGREYSALLDETQFPLEK